MGKAKPAKKPSSTLKISTSLFQRKGRSYSGSSSGTEDDSSTMSPVPSPSSKKSMKSKPTKTETKSKTTPKKGGAKGGQNATSSSASASKQSKSGVKTKAAIAAEKKSAAAKGKGSTSSSSQEKEKAGVKGKGSKQQQQGKKGSPSKTTTVTKTGKNVKQQQQPKKSTGKVTKVKFPTLRKRSKSNSTVTSSSSTTTTSSNASSSSRTPSPVQVSPKKSKASSATAKSPESKKPTTPAAKKKSAAATGGKSGKDKDTGDKEKGKDKDGKGKGNNNSNKSKKTKVTKVTTAKSTKGSAKPVKPKAKLKRMASLNAKAILEASFNSESSEKKQKSPTATVTPTKMTAPKTPTASTSTSTSTSTGTSMDHDDDYSGGDFKPLTLLFSGTQPELPIPKAKSLSPGGERKRKSSVVKIPPTQSPVEIATNTPVAIVDRRDSISLSIENSIAKVTSPAFRRSSGTQAAVGVCIGTSTSPPVAAVASVPMKIKKTEKDKGKSKSPTPKKKTKVASSSVSTSTSPFEDHKEVIAFQPKSVASKRGHQDSGIHSSGSETAGDRRTSHAPFSVQGQTNTHHQVHQSNQQHSSTQSGKSQKSASCQTKEKVNKSSTPVAHFGSTVYQPAGPLIEPHKTVMTGSVPAGLLPDSVRIPSDLKVTYQTHPPSTSVLTHSTSSFSSQSSKGSSSTKFASGHVKSHQSSAVPLKSNKQILHQPYKSSVTSAVTIASSGSATRPVTQVEVQQSASFVGTHPGSFSIPGSSSTLPTTTSFLSQQSQMGGGITIGSSHHVPSGALVPAGAGSDSLPAYAQPTGASAGIYYGYGTGASHSSPFTPSKYPFVAPDYRPSQHSPYQSSFMYAPGAPQPSPQSYFMTPFYTPPITPGGGQVGSLGGFGGQSRPLLSAHHPGAAAGASAAAAAYYQSGPPLAHHPASNYYVAGPSLQPSHHSIQPTTAPGHAGPSPPNRSSQTACPSTSCPPNNNSTSNNNSTTSNNSNNNNRANNRPLLPKRQPQPPSATGFPRQALDLAINKAKTPTVTATKNYGNRSRKECSTPALGVDPPKSVFSKSLDIVQSQAKQLESAKTFTEQYCLPDDITITPIIMDPSNASATAAAYYGNGLKSPSSTAQQRKRDIVHVIDPRSGVSTTIAKHISNNNLMLGSSPSNVSQVKPNNAGNVGKISPDLDVIVIGRGKSASTLKSQTQSQTTPKKTVNRRQSAGQVKGKQQQIATFPGPVQHFTSSPKNLINSQRMALSTSAVANNIVGSSVGMNYMGPFAPNHQIHGQFPITNLVQPLPPQHQVLAVARSENKSTKTPPPPTGVKRKGLSLNECIDGLKMKKKMRILGDTNISIKMGGRNTTDGIVPLSNTVFPLATSSDIPISLVMARNDGQQHKAGRKDNKPRRKVNPTGPGQARRVSATVGRRTTSTESDIGSMIINGPDAVVAASALVVGPHKANGSTVQLPMHFELGRNGGRRTPTPGSGLVKKDKERDSSDNPRRKPLKLKILGGKVITRSATQNSKVKTRAKSNPGPIVVGQQSNIGGGGPGTPTEGPKKGTPTGPPRNRQVLLRSKKDGNRSDSSAGFVRGGNEKASGTKSRPIFPSYFNTVAAVSAAAGNGSSTLTTSNNHVILRIPKSQGGQGSSSGRGGYTEVLTVDTTGRYGRYQTGLTVNPAVVSTSGNMTLNALKKRAIVKPLSPSVVNNGAIHSMPMANKKTLPTYPHPRWSNGWTFEGDSFEAKVYLRNDDQPVLRRCYASMRHDGGDVIRPRDCVLLKSGPRKNDLPFVAKVASLWENPLDGEMMFSLLWYYRPEHTEIGRSKEDMSDEIFASRHRDCNSVATIEDRCYVLTYNEYCRYKKRLKQLQDGIPGNIYPPLVPLSTNSAVSTMAVTNFAVDIASAVWSGISAVVKAGGSVPEPQPQLTPGKVSPEVVFFCRKVYDYRQKRMLKNPS